MNIRAKRKYCFLLVWTFLLTACADLVIRDVSYSPSCLTTNTPITFAAEVENIGYRLLGLGRSGPNKLAFKVGGETVPQTFDIPALDPGERHRVVRSAVLTVAQSYQNTITADVGNDVTERREDNNEAKQFYTVAQAPGTCAPGSSKFFLVVPDLPTPAKLLRIDPQTGAQMILAQGDAFATWDLTARGCKLWFGTTGVVRVYDVQTATETVFANDPQIDLPMAVAVAEDGTVYVAARVSVSPSIYQILRIDAGTRSISVVTAGGAFDVIDDLEVASDGKIYALSRYDQGGKVVRVDPATGNQTVISSGGNFHEPRSIWIDSDGTLLVGTPTFVNEPGMIVRVNPRTGAQTVVSSGGTLQTAIQFTQGIVTDDSGTIYVANTRNYGYPSDVMRIDPQSGVQMLLATGGSLDFPTGIAKVPAACFPSN